MYRSYQKIDRRKTRKIKIGNLDIGGDSPHISSNYDKYINILMLNQHQSQINKVVVNVGADIVRVSVPDQESTSKALKDICKNAKVPIIADIHFHYLRAIESAKNGASCLRINPGNIGSKEKVKDVIKAAKDYNCSMRIGINGGSLEKKIIQIKYSEPNPEALS